MLSQQSSSSSSPRQQPQTQQQQRWGWRQRFTSPDHFAFNAFIVLMLASGLIVIESFQFFLCYLAGLECLDFYGSPPAAVLYGSGLIIGVYLLLPGVLCLLAARRAPSIVETAMWTCIIGLVLLTILLATTVAEVAQYARLITRSSENRGRHSVNLLMCLAGITLSGVQLAFLSMETCVCRASLRRRRKGYRRQQLTEGSDRLGGGGGGGFGGGGQTPAELQRLHRCDEEDEDYFDENHDDGPTSL